MPVVGFLSAVSPGPSRTHVAAFHRGLNEVGYIEGQNVRIEYRWAEGKFERLPELAADLVRQKVGVIAAFANYAAVAAKQATGTIPTVVLVGGDPVELGLVSGLNRPGGNITGIHFFTSGLETKRLGLLHELVAKATTIGILANPLNPAAEGQRRDAQEAAARRVSSLSSSMPPPKMSSSPLLQLSLISASTRYRQVGAYTGRILKGTTIAELPVVRSTKFEFVINLRTAKALGLEVPNSLQLLADEVIE